MFIALFCLWWLLLAVFYIFPQIDLAVAGWFFHPLPCPTSAGEARICGFFPYNAEHGFRLLRESFFQLPYVVAAVLIWLLFRRSQEHGSSFRAEHVLNLKVALGSLLLGSVIIVNFWLKTFAHRPRPRDVLFFGGDLNFVQAGSFAGKCVANCSFISGESASAGWLFCLIFIIPQPLRSALALPILAVSLLTPALRVAFGAHFLSDAVLGWLSSPVIFSALLALSQTTQLRKISDA